MTTLDEFKEALKNISPEELIEKLASASARQKLLTADISFGQNAEATVAVLEAIPASVLAQQDDLQEIFEGLLQVQHPKRWGAIVAKLTEFDREQINTHPWLREFGNSPAVKVIHGHQEASENLSNHLEEISYQNNAAVFFGKPVAGNSPSDYIQAVSEMDPAETLKALQDPDAFRAMTRLGARNQDSGALVAACVAHIPVELWPDGSELVDTFKQVLSTMTQLALEAIATKIEEMSNQKLARSSDKIRQYFVTPGVRRIFQAEEQTEKIYQRVARAGQENDISSFLATSDPTVGDSVSNSPEKARPVMKAAPKKAPTDGFGNR